MKKIKLLLGIIGLLIISISCSDDNNLNENRMMVVSNTAVIINLNYLSSKESSSHWFFNTQSKP